MLRRMSRKQPDEPFAFAAKAEFAAAQEGQSSRKFSGLAYDGGVIRDHAYWSPLVVDLAGVEFATPSPALLDHDAPVGVIDVAQIDNQIRIGGRLFAGVNAKAKEIAEMADAGMPWQMSIRAHPGKIEEVGKGKKVEANGQTFTGPLTVFRNNRIPEVSFCALGAASNTAAQVFSGGNAANPGADQMDQAEHDRIVAELNGKLTAATELATKNAADLKKATDDLAAIKASADAKAKTERTDKVKALFKAIAVEFKDEAAKPYIDMTDEQFAAVSVQMSKRPTLDDVLTRTVATDGSTGQVDQQNTYSILTAARKYIAEQKKDRPGLTENELMLEYVSLSAGANREALDTRNAAQIGAL